MILAIKWLVGLKFSTMQRAIVESGWARRNLRDVLCEARWVWGPAQVWVIGRG